MAIREVLIIKLPFQREFPVSFLAQELPSSNNVLVGIYQDPEQGTTVRRFIGVRSSNEVAVYDSLSREERILSGENINALKIRREQPKKTLLGHIIYRRIAWNPKA